MPWYGNALELLGFNCVDNWGDSWHNGGYNGCGFTHGQNTLERSKTVDNQTMNRIIEESRTQAIAQNPVEYGLYDLIERIETFERLCERRGLIVSVGVRTYDTMREEDIEKLGRGYELTE